MKRNKRLLLKAADRIEKIPESYDQGTFARPEESAPCGTAGCLAGEIIIASERSIKKGVAKLTLVIKQWEKSMYFGNHEERLRLWPGAIAGKLAGLKYEEQRRLFIFKNWRDLAFTFPSRFCWWPSKDRAETTSLHC